MNNDKRAVIMYITQRIDAGRETKHDVNKLAHLTYELVQEQQAIADAWVAQKEWFRTEWESHDRVPPPPEPNVFVLLDALGGTDNE